VSNRNISEDIYFDIIKDKTAALFAACAESGARAAGASAEDIERLKTFGEIVGICFQIRDDIFDYQDDATIGKPTGNDMKEGKLTLPVIHALFKEASDEMFGIAYKVKDGTVAPEEVERLVKFTKDNGGIDYAYEVMERYAAEAKALLEKYPAHIADTIEELNDLLLK
jgi:octaprenyl-diphosphate synthase